MKHTLSIPYPENPEHVDNLKSVSLLEAQGFTGPDASLAISLFEYGMAWRTLPDGDLLVIHECRPGRFDRLTFKPDVNPEKEWDWVKWGDVAECAGMNCSEFLALPLTDVLFSLRGYYGSEEIFGTTYWEGFKISED